jgi:hypothetical protein
MKRKMTSEEVFLLWKKEAKEVGKIRYTAIERREQLDLLCEMFLKFGVELDDAKFYKRKVVDFMVTKEGQKGNGKHKGWKEATEEDFLTNLIAYYQGDMEIVNDTQYTVKGKNLYYSNADYLDRNKLIAAWTKNKYGDRYSESLCLEAHKIGSVLWQLFEKEVMQSKWARCGERPSWAKNIC